MDLRKLIGLIPFPPARAPLHGLLDRIETIERRLQALEQAGGRYLGESGQHTTPGKR